MQMFNITAFYPIDDLKPCYLPKIKEGQVLSIANSKFTKRDNNELDISKLLFKKLFYLIDFLIHFYLLRIFFFR